MSSEKIAQRILTKAGLNRDSLPSDLNQWQHVIDQFQKALQENIERKIAQEHTLEVSLKEMERLHIELKKKTDAEVQQQKAKYEVLATAVDSFSMLTICDGKGVITDANDKFCEMSGYSLEDLIGKTHRIIKSGFHNLDFYQDLWSTILKGSIWRGEVCNKTKSGQYFWVDTTIVPILAQSGVPTQFITMRFDISDRKKTESTLISSSKMASLGEMAASMAHEINNPLTIILGIAGRLELLILNNKLDPVKLMKDVKIISDTCMRIAKIIKGLRSFSRSGEEDPFQLSSLKQIVNETLPLCQERFKVHGVELRVKEFSDLTIHCRAVQISQVILNLLNNAYDAIESKPKPWIELEVEHKNDKVFILVTDSGNGIPKNIVDKLMHPFFTTKEVGKGTGLGLSISKKIVEEHQGKFWYEMNCPNTRFVIELPLPKNQES